MTLPFGSGCSGAQLSSELGWVAGALGTRSGGEEGCCSGGGLGGGRGRVLSKPAQELSGPLPVASPPRGWGVVCQRRPVLG